MAQYLLSFHNKDNEPHAVRPALLLSVQPRGGADPGRRHLRGRGAPKS